jgi:hypothetical protein
MIAFLKGMVDNTDLPYHSPFAERLACANHLEISVV